MPMEWFPLEIGLLDIFKEMQKYIIQMDSMKEILKKDKEKEMDQ